LFLFGADAITSEGKVINKIGTELICEKATDYNVLNYSCTDSWKFDPKSIFGFEEDVERRTGKEIWKNHPKGLKFSNYAFEMIAPEVMNGVITELGVYSSEILVQELKRKYKWMFI